MTAQRYNRHGFTLIELSIVLVIIGLIVGGVLVGRDLINAAAGRAQISQIQKYHQAVNTFRAKYGYLPGDMPTPQRNSFGMAVDASFYPGAPNGDGIVGSGEMQTVYGGEYIQFWNDLATAGLVSRPQAYPGWVVSWQVGEATGSAIARYVPPAALGGEQYVYVWGDNIAPSTGAVNQVSSDGGNWFAVSRITTYSSYFGSLGYTSGTMPVNAAYSIDQKADDGLPQAGVIRAGYIGYVSGNGGGNIIYPTNATTGTSATCFDKAGNAGGVANYSTNQNNGSGANCALSFKFQ